MGKSTQFIETGKLLRKARLAADISQHQLAKKSGLTTSTISKYELGYSMPDKYTANTLATVLGVDYSDIFKVGLRKNPSPLIGTRRPFTEETSHHQHQLCQDLSPSRCSRTSDSQTSNNANMYMLLFKVIELFGCKINIAETATLQFNSDKCVISPQVISEYLQDYISIKQISDRGLVDDKQIAELFQNLMNKYAQR